LLKLGVRHRPEAAIIQLRTESTGVTYRVSPDKPPLTRQQLPQWLEETKQYGAEQVILQVDARTTFFVVSELLHLLKESGIATDFELYVTDETQGAPKFAITHALQLQTDQVAPVQRTPVPPPDDSPEAAAARVKPWTPPPPKLTLPK
jgi:hypothetical protein